MKTLQELALEATTSNIVKKSKGTSINDLLLKVLTKDVKMTRVEIVSRITILRLNEQGYNEEKMVKLFESKDVEFSKTFAKINTTCKNGVDTSLAKGSTNANFSFNPDFKNYEIKKDGDKYYIVKLK